jgi:hypothetical protein
MTYNILSVRTADEDDGRLYPVVTDDGYPVQLEEWDGDVQTVVSTGVEIYEFVDGQMRQLLALRDVKADVLISDSRVVVACRKFDKGGGWVGFGGAGAAFALAANGVSKMRAAHRRHGKVLAGQIRFAWLRCVGYKPKTGWANNEEIRLGVTVQMQDGTKRPLYLDLTLPKNVSSSEVARAIVQRAARYRIANTKIDDDTERAEYEKLVNAASLPAPEPKKFALYQLSRFYFVGTGSAYPIRPSAEAPAS